MKIPYFIVCAFLFFSSPAYAAGYRIDPTHSFVQIRIQHLGYSWLIARFNTISGVFNYIRRRGGKAQSY